MKIRVMDSDGVYKGGLFKTATFNAMNCRVWQAPPHPDYTESLIDIAGKDNPCYDSSWFRLQIANVPDLSGPADGTDVFDANSLAYGISLEEAYQWFLRHGFTPPTDLLALLEKSVEAGSPLPVTSLSGAAQTPRPLAPLPDAAREVWDALHGRLMTAKQIAKQVGSTEDAIRKRLDVLERLGRVVLNQRGAGYYRPDAPPPELGPAPGAQPKSG